MLCILVCVYVYARLCVCTYKLLMIVCVRTVLSLNVSKFYMYELSKICHVKTRRNLFYLKMIKLSTELTIL